MPSLSEETLCFTAKVCIDGKVVGNASNHGHGGCTTVSIENPIIRGMHSMSEWETIVDELTFKELKKKEDAKLTKSIQKQLARDIIFTRKGDEFNGRHFLFEKGNTTPQLATACRAKLAQMADLDLILNDQPMDIVFKIMVNDA